MWFNETDKTVGIIYIYTIGHVSLKIASDANTVKLVLKAIPK